MADAKTFNERVKCPQGHRFEQTRRLTTAGRTVLTYCPMCRKAYQIKAGPIPAKKG
jgi:hypothetical protein